MLPFTQEEKELHEKHVEKRLRFRISIYGVISFVIFCIMLARILEDQVNLAYPAVGIALGTIMGIAVSRMMRIDWDHSKQKVTSRFDIIGVSILILYILFEIFRDSIVGLFIHGPELVATSLAVLAGIMIGRFLGTRGKVRKAIRENV